MLTGNLFMVDAVDCILSHAEEEMRHDGVDVSEVVEEEDAQLEVAGPPAIVIRKTQARGCVCLRQPGETLPALTRFRPALCHPLRS